MDRTPHPDAQSDRGVNRRAVLRTAAGLTAALGVSAVTIGTAGSA
ncbi:hypothetical protein [Streptomyces sp. V3I7]|nr:hypothetical protein [Streptomyces sp. V3I7]MDQ0989511.1 hypothetical protein [Streptomyces sp. V3I7]